MARPMLKTKVLEKYTDKIQELFEKYDNVTTEDVEDVKSLCEDVKRVGMLHTKRETKASVKIPKAIQIVISKKVSLEQPVQTPRRSEPQPQEDEAVLIDSPGSSGSSTEGAKREESYDDGEKSSEEEEEDDAVEAVVAEAAKASGDGYDDATGPSSEHE